MLSNTFKYVAVLACVLVLAGLSPTPAPAADGKTKPVPSGVWVVKGGELQLDFSNKGILKISPHAGGVLVIVCQCSIGKDGRVEAKITDFEGKNEEAKTKVKAKIPVGTAFSFQWKVKDATATLDALKGDEHLKSHLEGEYEQKKK